MSITLASITGSFDKTDLYLILITGLVTWFFIRAKNTHPTWDHFWQNLDKFLVTFMFLLVFVVAVKQAGQIWIQDLVKQLLPAVLALLGARAWSQRANGNGNGNGNSQTNTTATVVTTSSTGTAVLPLTNTTSDAVINTSTPPVV